MHGRHRRLGWEIVCPRCSLESGLAVLVGCSRSFEDRDPLVVAVISQSLISRSTTSLSTRQPVPSRSLNEFCFSVEGRIQVRFIHFLPFFFFLPPPPPAPPVAGGAGFDSCVAGSSLASVPSAVGASSIVAS